MNMVDIYEFFPTNDDCIAHIEKVRWGDRPECPYCKSDNSTPMPKQKRYHCNNCNTSYSVTVRTIFHHTHLPLQKWFLAISIILNAKIGIAARQLGRDLHVNKDTAWHMAMKIRDAMLEKEQRELLTGLVEMYETYIGGKPRKGTGPHKRGRGTKKTPIVGMVERKRIVKTEDEKNRKIDHKKFKSLVRKNIHTKNATLITGEYKGYIGIEKSVSHQVKKHSVWYVSGDTHINTIESFWALLKRGIVGQYHKVTLTYLEKYIDEFSYRWNHRKAEIDELLFSTLQRAIGGVQ